MGVLTIGLTLFQVLFFSLSHFSSTASPQCTFFNNTDFYIPGQPATYHANTAEDCCTLCRGATPFFVFAVGPKECYCTYVVQLFGFWLFVLSWFYWPSLLRFSHVKKKDFSHISCKKKTSHINQSRQAKSGAKANICRKHCRSMPWEANTTTKACLPELSGLHHRQL